MPAVRRLGGRAVYSAYSPMHVVWTNRIIFFLAVLAFFISANLWLSHALMKELPCTDAKGCASVAASELSRVGGIPVAAFGALFDLFVIWLCWWRANRPESTWQKTTPILWSLTSVALAVSTLLLFVGYQSLHVWCEWCAAHAALILLIWMAATVEWQIAVRGVSPMRIAREPARLGIVFALGIVATAGYGWFGVWNGPVMRVERVDSRAEILRPDSWSRGPADAPVTIVVFSDFQCPSCTRNAGLLKELLAKYPNTLREVYRHRSLYRLHPNAQVLSEIAEWAGEHGKFWEMHDAIFAKPELGQQGNFLPYARAAGLDPNELEKFLKQDRSEKGSARERAFQRTLRDLVDADKLDIQTTPTFFIVVRGADGKQTIDRTSAGAGLQRYLEEPHIKRLLGPAKMQDQ
ncbi:MAG: vitamin K epoxide reductase family protein [Fimbriimonadia bacterium]